MTRCAAPRGTPIFYRYSQVIDRIIAVLADAPNGSFRLLTVAFIW